MRSLPRLLTFAALGLLLWGIIRETRRHIAANADPGTIVLFFGGTLLVGLVLGVLVAISVAPLIGSRIGGFFYNPDEQVEPNPHAKAMAFVAQGDYPAAIEAYKAVLEENHADMHALSEIVHIYCDRLHEPEPAIAILESALETELTTEDAAFVAGRLAEVCWVHQKDALRARTILLQVAEMLPETSYAANAMHKVREIDHALQTGSHERLRNEAADQQVPG